MPFYRKPAKLEEQCSCLLVSEDPVVESIHVQTTPMVAVSPVCGFRRMHVSGVADGSMLHPAIQFVENLFCHSRAKGVGPTSNNGVQLCANAQHIVSPSFVPQFLELLLHVLD